MSNIIGIHVNDTDTCVTVAGEVHIGDTVSYSLHDGSKASVISKNEIPIYHKIAIVPHKEGDLVIKYGSKIGVATKDIEVGEHVHIHNIRAAGLKATKEGATAASSADLSTTEL